MPKEVRHNITILFEARTVPKCFFSAPTVMSNYTYVYANAQGNVGINNASPAYPLDIVGDLNLTGTFRKSAAAFSASPFVTSGSNVYIAAGSNLGIGGIATPAGPLQVGSNAALFVGSNAFVGIGTTAPAYPLDVAGNVRTSGYVDAALGSLTQNASLLPYVPFDGQTNAGSSNAALFTAWLQRVTVNNPQRCWWNNGQTNFFSSSLVTGTTAGQWSHNTAVLLPDGRVYLPPYNFTGGGGIFNPATNVYSSSIVSGSCSGNFAYYAACLLRDGRVYCAPFRDGGGGGIFNPATNVFSSNLVSGTAPGNNAYTAAILLPNGNVYCVPGSYTGGGGIFNPTTMTFTSNVIGTSFYPDGFLGGVLLPDGRVYCCPGKCANTSGGGIYNPTTNTFSSSIVSGNAGAIYIVEGAILLPNGLVYTPPANTTCGGGLFNPATNTFTTSTITGTNTSAYTYFGVLLADGCVYNVPANGTGGGSIFNPTTNVFSTSGITGTSPGGQAYSGGVLLPDGRVYCIPCGTTTAGGIFVRGSGACPPPRELLYHPSFVSKP